MKRNDTHHYHSITRQHVDSMLTELVRNGARIAGNNPWEISTRQSGVKLRSEWSEVALTLVVTLTGRDWYVPNALIWETIDGLVSAIRSHSDESESVILCSQSSKTGK